MRLCAADVPEGLPDLGHLRGARILLAEDNDINQQIACELLGDAGFVVEVADNGRVALEMAQRQPYDLVLMDMQMPVMDGLDATTAIRSIARLHTLPIVAMTANAMAEDRRDCLAAGMNDFLTKPINPDELWRMLLKWIQPPKVLLSAAASPAPAASQIAGGDLPEGIAGLNVRVGLGHMMGKKPLYLTMLRKYAAGQSTCVQNIRDALHAQDLATAQRVAHTLKGVSGTIGATQVAASAAAVEHAIRERCPETEIELALTELERPLAAFIAGLEAWFISLPA